MNRETWEATALGVTSIRHKLVTKSPTKLNIKYLKVIKNKLMNRET